MTRPFITLRQFYTATTLRAATYITALIVFAKARYDMAVADEAGLTAAEYVVLGAGVVVAVGAVGALIAGFLKAKAGQIIATP
jgi:uncharacterized protein (UPF0303 family)